MEIYCNGSFLDETTPCIRAQDRGFRFGDGLFETIAVHGGAPYQWAFHMKRLAAGLAALRIDYDIAPLRRVALELMARNSVKDGLLRIAISRGVGSRGYLPLGGEPTVVIEALEKPETPKNAVDLWQCSMEKISAKSMPISMKTAQGLASTLTRLEANERLCYDGLQMNAHGEICETGSANIFWLARGVLHTPSLSCGILEGSTRHAVLRTSPWPVKEGAYTLSALQEAEAVFITNASIGALAVAELKPLGWRWQSDRAASAIRARLEKDIAQDTARFHSEGL